jgi:hypothetical protein
LDISRNQIEALRASDVLASEVGSRLSDPALLSKPRNDISESEWIDLEDACLEALRNESQSVEDHCADQGCGIYPITILGIPGAYFVTANEFDPAGVFNTLEEAQNHVSDVHGEFLVNPDSEDDDTDSDQPAKDEQ